MRISDWSSDVCSSDLDARTGKEAWKTYDYPDKAPRNSNGAPRVFGGKVIVGFGGADISPARGFVNAYDENTGKQGWRFDTNPGDEGVPANKTAGGSRHGCGEGRRGDGRVGEGGSR